MLRWGERVKVTQVCVKFYLPSLAPQTCVANRCPQMYVAAATESPPITFLQWSPTLSSLSSTFNTPILQPPSPTYWTATSMSSISITTTIITYIQHKHTSHPPPSPVYWTGTSMSSISITTNIVIIYRISIPPPPPQAQPPPPPYVLGHTSSCTWHSSLALRYHSHVNQWQSVNHTSVVVS